VACWFLAQEEIGWEDILAPHFRFAQQPKCKAGLSL
jgi:hypothetical protein